MWAATRTDNERIYSIYMRGRGALCLAVSGYTFLLKPHITFSKKKKQILVRTILKLRKKSALIIYSTQYTLRVFRNLRPWTYTWLILSPSKNNLQTSPHLWNTINEIANRVSYKIRRSPPVWCPFSGNRRQADRRRQAIMAYFSCLLYTCYCIFIFPSLLPCGGLEEVGLAVHQLRPEFGHLLLHFAHFTVEPIPDAREFRIDHTEVAQLNRDIALVFGHFYTIFGDLISCKKRILFSVVLHRRGMSLEFWVVLHLGVCVYFMCRLDLFALFYTERMSRVLCVYNSLCAVVNRRLVGWEREFLGFIFVRSIWPRQKYTQKMREKESESRSRRTDETTRDRIRERRRTVMSRTRLFV